MGMGIDQRLADYFTAVYEKRSVTAAAEKLFISRQSVSTGLAQLEAQLGFALFTRGKSGCEPTAEAHALARCLADQEALWRRFRDETETARGSGVEVVRVGMQGSVFEPEDIHRVLQYERLRPGARVDIVAGTQDEFLAALRAGELEIAYASGVPHLEGLFSVPIVDKPLALLVAADDPLARRACVDFARDLRGRTVLSIGLSGAAGNVRAFERVGATVQHLPDSRSVLLERLKSGAGVFIVLSDIVERFRPAGVCAVQLANCDGVDARSFVVYRPGLGRAARGLIRHILGFHYKQVPPLPDEAGR